MAKYRLSCGNAFVDGVYNDFVSDEEAAAAAANYEATCYRLEESGAAILIYKPGQDDPEEVAEGER